MQVTLSNDVKVYNLSAGKSLPEWISDRKRRKLEQKDVDIRRRIQLIQDFQMNNVSHSICVSRDGRYILAAGSYKPTVKCYEVNELSVKFERGLDADVIKIVMLGDDYSKFALLEEERYLELHTNYGKYFRLRIPKFGRDISFCREASELYIVGSGNEIFRLNLEEGKFLEPMLADAPSLTACQFNDEHQLFVAGTAHGRVEAWDYRDRNRVGILDVASHAVSADGSFQPALSEVSCLKFKDALNLAVGTSSGHTLLYDIRSSKPLLVKDQRMGLPIKQIEFVKENSLVLTMDSRALKMWHEDSGDPFAALEPGTKLNDFARYPNSGLVFFANDAEKMLQYFIPSLGPAPKWCSYLDSITEELEESEQPAVYDDYKFVTKAELEELGLSNLLGTSMLRAYMHGYFIDIRLYNRARTLTQPQAYESYKRRKLREKIEEERESTTIRKEAKLPKVNKVLASKLLAGLSIGSTEKVKKDVKQACDLLQDERFKQLFHDPDFEVDQDSEQYKQIAPMLKKLESKKPKRTEEPETSTEHQLLPDFLEEETNDNVSSHSDSDDDDSERSESVEDSDDQSLRDADGGSEESDTERDEPSSSAAVERAYRKPQSFKLVGVDSSREFNSFVPSHDDSLTRPLNATLGKQKAELAAHDRDIQDVQDTPFGGKSISFTIKDRNSKKAEWETKQQEHLDERKASRRSAGAVMRHLKPLPATVQGQKTRRRRK